MKNGILAQITELETLPIAALKARWRDLYDTEPPSYNRAHLVKRLAYRIQELAYGGLSEATRDQLREHLEREQLDTETERTARSTALDLSDRRARRPDVQLPDRPPGSKQAISRTCRAKFTCTKLFFHKLCSKFSRRTKL